MTHVLMTADTVGGVWTYALEMAEALAPHGVTLSLATMGRSMTRAQRHEVERSPVVEVHEAPFALEWMAEPWHDVDRAGDWLLRLEDLGHPDVVHLNGYCHAHLPWQAPTLVAAHSCVLSWWWAVHGVEAPPQFDEYRRRVTVGLAAAGAVVAPSLDMLTALRRWYGNDRGSVVPNCRRAGWVNERSEERLVLAAGRVWDEAKNLAVVDRVASRIGWPVVIAGSAQRPDGGRGPEPGGARWLGELSFHDLAGWLHRAPLFVLPARYEPFGLGALEAGLAGCTLVLGDIGSLREVWRDAAIYVDPEDEDQLAHTLDALAGDCGRRAELGHRARLRAAAYTPMRTALGYLDAYRSLAVVAGDRQ